jgi:Flp pilus assembly protein TadG
MKLYDFRAAGAGSFAACSAGAVAVVTALVLPLLLGFTSLGVEVGHWYLVQREMQGAADAAAISASAQYITDQVAGNTPGTYQTVGQSYASTNGFIIPTSNVCLVTLSGDNCDTVRSLDSRSIICSAPPCIVAEITQDTGLWTTTKASLEPTASLGRVQAIPTPTLKARAIVSVVLTLSIQTPQGNSCILALANDRNAIQVRGNGDIYANCGLLIDGGRGQNARTPTITSSPLCSDGTTPPCAGLTLSGNNAMVHISNLTVAASTAGPTGSTCLDPPPLNPPPNDPCFLYNPSTTVLPSSKIFKNTATPDPFAGRIFTKPTGVVVTGVTIAKGGNNYTNGTRTFTVTGGTGIPAQFTATVNNSSVVTGAPVIVDPGAGTPPANPVSATADDGKGSGATFNLMTANCVPGATSWLPGRAYCSINASVGAKGHLNFSTGIYYIEGGETGCVGLCISAGTYTSDSAGLTFVLTNTANGSNYAQYSIAGDNTVTFTAPPNNINADGSACSTSCANTTWGMIIFQDRNAPITTALGSGGAVTSSNPAAGSTLNSMSGCGGNTCRTLSGSIYLPNQTANFSGNGQVQGTCFGLVSKYLDDAGVPIFQNGCLPGTTGGSGGTGSVTGGSLMLAE